MSHKHTTRLFVVESPKLSERRRVVFSNLDAAEFVYDHVQSDPCVQQVTMIRGAELILFAHRDYRLETFGRDCLGNITGYRVVTGVGRAFQVIGAFVGNIYVPGSFQSARDMAEAMLRSLTS